MLTFFCTDHFFNCMIISSSSKCLTWFYPWYHRRQPTPFHVGGDKGLSTQRDEASSRSNRGQDQRQEDLPRHRQSRYVRSKARRPTPPSAITVCKIKGKKTYPAISNHGMQDQRQEDLPRHRQSRYVRSKTRRPTPPSAITVCKIKGKKTYPAISNHDM